MANKKWKTPLLDELEKGRQIPVVPRPTGEIVRALPGVQAQVVPPRGIKGDQVDAELFQLREAVLPVVAAIAEIVVITGNHKKWFAIFLEPTILVGKFWHGSYAIAKNQKRFQ